MAEEKAQTLFGSPGLGLPRVFGIEVRIDYSWFIVFGLVLWTLAAGYFPRTFPGQQAPVYWVMGFVSAVLLFGSVLAHELSHAVVAQREGLPVPRITLFIFGGVAHLSREPSDPGSEFRIAVIGPVTSLVLAGLFWAVSLPLAPASEMLGQTFLYLGVANFLLAVFNLIPGFPLDGGRVLRAWLWNRWNDLRRATQVVTGIGKGMGTALILLGILELFGGLLVGGLWLVFIGLFLRQAAQSSYQMTALQEALRGIRVAEIMRAEPVEVRESLRLDELANDFFYRYRFNSFPVVEGQRLTGLIHINQVKDVPRERWSQTTVGEVMTPREKIATVGPEEEAFAALRQMNQSGHQKIPVVQNERLVGIITARDIMELFRVRTDLAA